MGFTELQVAAQQAIRLICSARLCEINSMSSRQEMLRLMIEATDTLRAALAEPPFDDPHRDHWVAIAEAAQKIAASKDCGLMEAKALCAALDRLTEAMLAESEERNFCPRCGKRANGIHTCTPPQEEHFCDTHCTWADHAPGCVRAEPMQEPAAWSCINGTSDTKWHPPQRKPLTLEEILSISAELAAAHRHDEVHFARAIERAHGITP